MTSKTGILTFQNTINYGAVLQAYSLQQFLLSLGLSTEVINYFNDEVTRRESIKRLKDLKTIKQIIKYFLSMKSMKRKRKKIDDFCKSHIINKQKKYFQGDLLNDFDNIIVGSDQVWNCLLTGNDYTYFLKDFNNSKHDVFE